MPKHRRWRCFGILMFFAGATFAATFPQGAHLSDHTGAHTDALFSAWRLAWVAHAITTTPSGLFQSHIFYPEPSTFAYSDALLLPGLLAAPLFVSGLNPLTAYNFVLLATMTGAGVAAYFLVRRLTGSVVGGLIAGLLFSISTHQLEHFERFELQTGLWMPLTLMALHRAITTGGRRYAVLAGLLSAAQVLSGIYIGILFVPYIAVLLVFLTRGRSGRLALGLVMLAIPLATLAVYSTAYASSRERVGERRWEEVATYSAKPADLLSSHPANRLYGAATAHIGGPERHLFPGLIASLLGIVGCIGARCRIRSAYLMAGLAAFLLMLGANTPVYGWFYDWLPPFRALRVPARAAILFNLSLGVLVGFGAKRTLSAVTSPSLRRCVGAALVIGAAIEYRAAPSLRRVDSPSRVYRMIQSEKSGVLFEWPVARPDRLDTNDDAVYMFNNIGSWHPMVNGYSGFYPPSYLELLDRMQAFPGRESVDYLRSRNVHFVVLHQRELARSEYDKMLASLVTQDGVHLVFREQDASGDHALLVLNTAIRSRDASYADGAGHDRLAQRSILFDPIPILFDLGGRHWRRCLDTSAITKGPRGAQADIWQP